MSAITKIIARQVLDSRGNPTIEADLYTEAGAVGRASVPSGASTGSREALELRDGDKAFYLGKSVRKAIQNINEKIAPKLIGKDVLDLRELDNTMLSLDGTDFKNNLGANAMLAVSMAACRAGAMEKRQPLYVYLRESLQCPTEQASYNLPAPLMNIINGGEHASNNLDIQEFMIVPHLKNSFSENLRAGVEVFHHLKKVLESKNYSTNVGDEGGFAPSLNSHEEAIECILEAIKNAGYIAGDDISISLDVAASEFYNKETGLYTMGGDDLFVTNEKIFSEGISKGEANAILVKINQIGTISETFDTLNLAFKSNYKAIISHRSGETADSFIADLAVACSSGHIKTGSASRSDRIEKYNQLLRIEEELGEKAVFHPIK